MTSNQKSKMKPHSDSYSSPSSSSTSFSSSVNFDPTMCSSKSATAGCLTGIIRRILCSNSLPTHPSDQIREVNSNPIVYHKDQKLDAYKQNSITSVHSSPGIVARLMGLDSMEEIPTESSQSSLSRSRSMSSLDCPEQSNRMQGLHRRVKSTLSFREVPTFLFLENENFFVLSFENSSETRDFGSKARRREKGSAELKQKRDNGSKLKENKREKVYDEKILNQNEVLRRKVSKKSPRNGGSDFKLDDITNTLPQFKVSSENKCVYSEAEKFSQKEIMNGKILKKQQQKKKRSCRAAKKIEPECNSEDLSPVSVLDFDREAPKSDSLVANLSSRRKLSTELEKEQNHSQSFDGNLMVEERDIKAMENNKYDGLKKIEKNRKEYVDIWGEVCWLAKDELVGSDAIHGEMWKMGDLESLSADFESVIFYDLMNELIDQLSEHPLKSLKLQIL